MTKVKPYSKLTMKQKLFVVIIPAIFAVYTPIAEIIAFVGLSANMQKITSASSDALVINANWDSNPIIDVKLETTACGSGYSQLGTQA